MRSSTLSLIAAVVAGAGCVDLDMTRQTVDRGTFGETIFQEVCQRLARVTEVEEVAAGLRETADASGQTYYASCAFGEDPPDGAPVKLAALVAQRPALVPAIDVVAPDSLLDPLQAFFEAAGKLFDEGIVAELIDRADKMVVLLRDDAELGPALARLGPRTGYRPAKVAEGFVQQVVNYPRLDQLFSSLLALIDEGGAAKKPLDALLEGLSYELRWAKPDKAPADGERNLKLALDLALTTNPKFSEGTKRLLVARDWRGFASVALVGGKVPAPFADKNGDGLADIDDTGHFVDAKGAPIEPGAPFPPLAGDKEPRDAAGRLVRADGQPVYRYLDLDPTLLGALLREGRPWLDPDKDIGLGLLYGATALLGPKIKATRHYELDGKKADLSYSGYDTKKAPVLDLAYAALQVLDAPKGTDTLRFARALLTTHEPELARALAAMLDARDRGKLHSEAVLPRRSTVFDDMVPIIIRILRVPGLIEDLMDALENPHVKGLGPMLAYQAMYKDPFVLDQVKLTVSGSWKMKVDRGAPDSEANRSVFERVIHLVHDANGTRYCNKAGAKVTIFGKSFSNYGECQMFDIEDIGLLYILSMADPVVVDDKNRPETRNHASFREQIVDPVLRAVILDSDVGDSVLQNLTGIDGFKRFPTTQAETRTLFLDEQHRSEFLAGASDVSRCRDGDKFTVAHPDTLFAWEKPIPDNPSGFPNDSFLDAIRPIVTAFAKHDECIATDQKGSCTKVRNAAKIFLDFVSVMHLHWGAKDSTYGGGLGFQSIDPAQPRYATGDGGVTYEPLLGELLRDTDLMPAAIDLVKVVNHMNIDGTGATGPARPVLVSTMSYIFDPNASPGLTYRDGRTEALRLDGKTAGKVTPFYLLGDAFFAKEEALDAADAGQAGGWRSATSAIVDQFFGATKTGAAYKFANANVVPTGQILIDFLLGRLKVHEADRRQWLRQDLIDLLDDFVGGPVLAALGDMAGALEGDPAARTEVYKLLQHLLSSTSSDSFVQLQTTLADLLQMALDDADLVPLMHAMGKAIEPKVSPASAGIKALRRARALDPACPEQGGKECALVTLMGNLWERPGKGDLAVTTIGDAMAEVHRVEPGKGGHLAADDYRALLDQMHLLLADEERGLARFLEIMKDRRR